MSEEDRVKLVVFAETAEILSNMKDPLLESLEIKTVEGRTVAVISIKDFKGNRDDYFKFLGKRDTEGKVR